MVLIISTFKVANGMEAAVREAFLHRPGLVDDAPGFLGMEVSVDRLDGSIFHLQTRWTDEESFSRWHSSPNHNLSHRGIPKGLKLDASYTAVRKFDVLPGKKDGGQEDGGEHRRNTMSFPAKFLARSRWVYWLRSTLDGVIIDANTTFQLLLQESGGAVGESLWNSMTEADAASVQTLLRSEILEPEGPILLNFASADHVLCTLECQLERHSEDFVLVGEIPHHDHRELARELLELNNRWALLVRENEKNAKALRQTREELEKALVDVNESHWHLRKIQETLPICMYCGKVKTGEARWEEVVEYLKANSLFLTHGCCPACLDHMTGPKRDGFC